MILQLWLYAITLGTTNSRKFCKRSQLKMRGKLTLVGYFGQKPGVYFDLCSPSQIFCIHVTLLDVITSLLFVIHAVLFRHANCWCFQWEVYILTSSTSFLDILHACSSAGCDNKFFVCNASSLFGHANYWCFEWFLNHVIYLDLIQVLYQGWIIFHLVHLMV